MVELFICGNKDKCTLEFCTHYKAHEYNSACPTKCSTFHREGEIWDQICIPLNREWDK